MDKEKSAAKQIRDQVLLQMCKRHIEQNIEKYATFVQERMDDDKLEDEARYLMPFSEVIKEAMPVGHSDGLEVALGFVVMHMDVSPDIYTFGLTLHVTDESAQKSLTAVRYVAACQTFTELRAWIKSNDFQKEAEENLIFALNDCMEKESNKPASGKVQQTNRHDYGRTYKQSLYESTQSTH